MTIADRWDERYRQREHIQGEPHPLLVRLADELPPGRALDVACGAGRHALYLAERGWQVTAVDVSQVALELLQARARALGLHVDTRRADLERGEFLIEPDCYDLIVNCCYLQRDLFPAMRAGVRVGGVVLAVIALIDDDPQVKPMNPAFLLQPGELRAAFADWELSHYREHKQPGRRLLAELIARRVVLS
ncbi:MAG: methyltransferase domain-containing protein [Acidobacteria bacterium]|nr:methyltransferase domain-containing protein [Acidobacteriota bacterium]